MIVLYHFDKIIQERVIAMAKRKSKKKESRKGKKIEVSFITIRSVTGTIIEQWSLYECGGKKLTLRFNEDGSYTVKKKQDWYGPQTLKETYDSKCHIEYR